MNTQFSAKVKLKLPAGVITVAPPIGPALGQYGINLVKFCNEFNSLSSIYENNTILNVKIFILKNKNFVIKILGPNTSFLIKQILDIQKGSNNPGKQIVKTINICEIYELAKKKINFFNTEDIESFVKSICGTIKSMGIKINDK